MKLHYLILLFLISTTQLIGQSSYMKSYQDGYHSNITQIEAFENGDIITAGSSKREGNYGRLIPLIKRFDSTGVLIWADTLPDQIMESYYITDLKITPDGGWAVCGEGGACDAYGTGFFFKFNAEDELEWSLNNGGNDPDNVFPLFDKIGLLSEGKIYLTHDNTVMIYDATGELLDDFTLPDIKAVAFQNDDFLIASTISGTLYSIPYADLSTYNYLNTYEFADENTFYQLKLEKIKSGRYILQVSPHDDILVIDDWGEVELTREVDDSQSLFYTVSDEDKLVVTRFSSSNYAYTVIYQEGLDPYRSQHYQTDFNIEAIAFNNSNLYVAGNEGIIQHNSSGINKQRLSFLHKQDFEEPDLDPELDLELSAIYLDDMVETTNAEYYQDVYGHTYTFKNLEVEVTNNSEVPIHSFFVNTIHESLSSYICFPDQADAYPASNLNVESGQSASIFIEELTVFALDTANYKLCFWVTSPNQQPDLVHENDSICTLFSKDYLSAISNAPSSVHQLSVSPNPTSSQISVEHPFPFDKAVKYNIFTLDSKSVDSDQLADNQNIDVSHLRKGIYIIQIVSEIGTANAKFIKL